MFLNRFDMLLLKINFKKYYFNVFLNKKSLKLSGQTSAMYESILWAPYIIKYVWYHKGRICTRDPQVALTQCSNVWDQFIFYYMSKISWNSEFLNHLSRSKLAMFYKMTDFFNPFPCILMILMDKMVLIS